MSVGLLDYRTYFATSSWYIVVSFVDTTTVRTSFGKLIEITETLVVWIPGMQHVVMGQ